MKLSKAKAKKIGIEVWDYLAKHGDVWRKCDICKFRFNMREWLEGIRLWKIIKDMRCECPLCEYFFNGDYCECQKCILNQCVLPREEGGKIVLGYYDNWQNAKTNEMHEHCAAIIRDKIKEW